MPDIDFGQISESLNNKSDRDLRNIDTTAKADAVIDYQEPTSANNYTWYRKYASGWVEQGGQATTNSGNPKQITLPLEMANIYYNINITPQTLTDGYTNAGWNVIAINTTASPKTNTNFYAQPSITGYNLPFYWQVSGITA